MRDWLQVAGTETWEAEFDRPDPDGDRWKCVVEPRGGKVDQLLAKEKKRGSTLNPRNGPWVWAMVCTSYKPGKPGSFPVGACGSADTRDAAMEQAEELVQDLVALQRGQAEQN